MYNGCLGRSLLIRRPLHDELHGESYVKSGCALLSVWEIEEGKQAPRGGGPILTRSPDLGLFFGRVGKASSFGLVSIAQ